MKDSPSKVTGSSGPLRPLGNGNGRVDVVDRSYLLRRATKFPFPLPVEHNGVLRVRRERRVFSSFAGIPSLSRRRSS
jgi:hypothetical protein